MAPANLMNDCNKMTGYTCLFVKRSYRYCNLSNVLTDGAPSLGQNCRHLKLANFVYVVLRMRKSVTVTPRLFTYIQNVPLATEPGISVIILTPMKILQRHLNSSTFFSFTFITQWGKSASNLVAISSLVENLLKKCRVR
jgi:hypothetical protein